ncbi:hypothetical protein ACJJTC_008718 [Scirpophaga incertulas]
MYGLRRDESMPRKRMVSSLRPATLGGEAQKRVGHQFGLEEGDSGSAFELPEPDGTGLCRSRRRQASGEKPKKRGLEEIPLAVGSVLPAPTFPPAPKKSAAEEGGRSRFRKGPASPERSKVPKSVQPVVRGRGRPPTPGNVGLEGRKEVQKGSQCNSLGLGNDWASKTSNKRPSHPPGNWNGCSPPPGLPLDGSPGPNHSPLPEKGLMREYVRTGLSTNLKV